MKKPKRNIAAENEELRRQLDAIPDQFAVGLIPHIRGWIKDSDQPPEVEVLNAIKSFCMVYGPK